MDRRDSPLSALVLDAALALAPALLLRAERVID